MAGPFSVARASRIKAFDEGESNVRIAVRSLYGGNAFTTPLTANSSSLVCLPAVDLRATIVAKIENMYVDLHTVDQTSFHLP
jgi:hypothetical protein